RNKLIELDKEEINNLKENITTLKVQDLNSAFDDYKRYIRRVNDFIHKQIENKIQEYKKTKKQIEDKLIDLDNLLEDRQQVIDTKLIYAVYFMILALVVLFIGLYFFNVEIAGKIIEKRSLVEVISMAFMLITIIILGTGGKIGNETLGTLLGTIAGYIFGRGVLKQQDK
ncbi:MAG: hypothetical protein AAF617_09300, partial [Bacteroidota bacterium]